MQYATCMPFHLKVLSSGEILNDFNFNLINSDNVSSLHKTSKFLLYAKFLIGLFSYGYLVCMFVCTCMYKAFSFEPKKVL